MILLDPKNLARAYPDARSAEIMRKTIEFFEAKGKTEAPRGLLRPRPGTRTSSSSSRKERIFASMCTPAGEGAADARWDTWRICEFAEILGFYGLQYWYTWQVSVLGLGPIWMSENEALRKRAARALEDGGIFAFGLSEKTHGADIYSTDMVLTPRRGRLARERAQVLHRQRQRGRHRLDLRPLRRTATSTCSSPPTRATRATT